MVQFAFIILRYHIIIVNSDNPSTDFSQSNHHQPKVHMNPVSTDNFTEPAKTTSKTDNPVFCCFLFKSSEVAFFIRTFMLQKDSQFDFCRFTCWSRWFSRRECDGRGSEGYFLLVCCGKAVYIPRLLTPKNHAEKPSHES